MGCCCRVLPSTATMLWRVCHFCGIQVTKFLVLPIDGRSNSLNISCVLVHSYDFFTTAPLVNVSIVFGLALIALAFFLNKYEIKSHFTFTYYHFGLLLIFIASLSGLFSKDNEVIYTLVVYAGVVLGIYLSRQTNSMLLLVYAVLTAYVVTTYWISELDWNNEIWYLYFMLSCGGLVYFIISARKFFKRKA